MAPDANACSRWNGVSRSFILEMNDDLSYAAPTIPGIRIFSHDSPCTMNIKGMTARVMPERVLVTGKMTEKQIALPIGRVPGYIFSAIIGITPHILRTISVVNSLTC